MGKGGGGPQQTTSQVTQSNVPEYARPYVENMLQATQRQLFTGTPGEGGSFDITGFQPYRAFGGTYDQQGNQVGYDPSAGIAGFDPMQTRAQQGIYNMQLPGEMGAASGYTQAAIDRANQQYYRPGQFGYDQVQNQQINAAQMGAAPEAQAAQAQTAQIGAAPTVQGAQVQGPGNVSAERVNAPNLRDLQMQGAGNVNTRSFTDQGARQGFMDPYMQDVVAAQTREAQRTADRAAVQRRGARAQQGAYGGSAAALENAEANRNLATQLGDIRAKGLESAYQSGMGQFNIEAQNRLQADVANQQTQQQTGVQNLSAALQTQGLGAQTGLTAQQLNQASGLQAGLANQQMGYNTSLQNAQLQQQANLANQGLQGQYGLQQGQFGQQTNLANQQALNQMALANQGLAGQYGMQQGQFNQQAAMQNPQLNMQAQLANQQARMGAQQAREQSRQFGAGYGQQGNAQALAGAAQLGSLGQQNLAGQQGIYGLQNQYGAQRQAYQQQILNQRMQDYANAQQYPLMQLGTMSNMLRGLPMQSQNTQMYTPGVNPISQGIGMLGAGASLYNAYNGTPGRASGGIVSYDVGGRVENTLEDMGVDELKKYAKESSSPSIKRMAARIIQEKSMPGMAGGGIIAFAEGDEVRQKMKDAGFSEATIERTLKENPAGKGVDLTPNPIRMKEGQANSGRDPAQVLRDFTRTSAAPPPAAPPPAAPAIVSGQPTSLPPGVAPSPGFRQAAPPPAPPAAPAGIAQAAAATAPAPRPPAGGPAGPAVPAASTGPKPPDLSNEYAGTIKEQLTKTNAEANKTPQQLIKEKEELYKSLGIELNDPALQDYRKKVMAERANMEEEASRQRWMRSAEFFAGWGSTPGPVLVAGMKNLKTMIPTLIEDQKEAKKLMKEADKAIFDIDRSIRLEKIGHADQAISRLDAAKNRAIELQGKLLDHQDKKNQTQASIFASQSSAAASDISSARSLQGQLANAAAVAGGAAATREATAHARQQTNLATVDNNTNQAIQHANDSFARNATVQEAQKAMGAMEAQRDPTTGKFKDPTMQALYNNYSKIIKDAQTVRDKQIYDAQQQQKRAYSAYSPTNTGAAPARQSGTSGAKLSDFDK